MSQSVPEQPIDELKSLIVVIRQRLADIDKPSPRSLEGIESSITQLEQWSDNAEARVQRSRSIIDAALDAFVGMDSAGVIVDWNAMAQQIFGWTRDEAIGRSLADTIIPPRFREAHQKGLEHYLVTGEGPVMNKRLEMIALRKDDSEFPVELTIFAPIRIEGQWVFNAFLRDITDRTDSEHAIRESESLYHSLVDTLPIHVTRKDLNGVITYVNPLFCELVGMSPNNILGKTDYDFFPPELADKYRSDDRWVVETGKVFSDVEENRTDGRTIFFEVRKTPVRDGKGEIVGTQAIFWDVTRRKEAEDAIERHAAELERSNRDLDQFAAVVSHDLQAPLRGVSMCCELVQDQCGDAIDPETEELVTMASDGAHRMQRLIADLRRFAVVTSKAEAHQTVDCEKALAEALANLSVTIEETGANITHDKLPTVVAEPTQLMQLFQNLIGNAIKYCRDRAPAVHVSAVKDDGRWTIGVRDNGIGIEPSYLKDIFRIFHRTFTGNDEFAGTGIGLAVCKRIVDRHGGSIWVESEPDVGSTFYFTLPEVEQSLDADALPGAGARPGVRPNTSRTGL